LLKKELSLVTELIDEVLDLEAVGVSSPGKFDRAEANCKYK
jgi:hypothetical protein